MTSLEAETVAWTALVDRSPSPEEAALAVEEQRSVAALLAHLTPDQRRVDRCGDRLGARLEHHRRSEQPVPGLRPPAAPDGRAVWPGGEM